MYLNLFRNKFYFRPKIDIGSYNRLTKSQYMIKGTVKQPIEIVIDAGSNIGSQAIRFINLNPKIKKNETTLLFKSYNNQYEDGEQKRDFIYVKDVAKAFIATMLSNKTGNGEVINIGTGITTTMEEIAKTIGGEVKFIPRRNFEVEAHQADMKNCYKLLDWRPKVKVLEWLSNFVKNI